MTSNQCALPLPPPPTAASLDLGGCRVEPVQARSILARSRIPGAEFAINPYTGCGFGCSYCYAVFMCRFADRPAEDWGRFVHAKVNLPEVLRRELRSGRRRSADLFLSSVTDPYQPAEAHHRLTRAALQALVDSGHQGTVQVMTRSPLVLRDLDLLTRLRADVGLSMAPLYDDLAAHLEPRSPPLDARLDALRRLGDAGVRTYVFAGPIFPHIETRPEDIDRLFASIRDAGTEEVYVAWFNLRPDARRRMLGLLEGVDPEIVDRYYRRGGRGPKRAMEPFVHEALDRHGLRPRTQGIIDH